MAKSFSKSSSNLLVVTSVSSSIVLMLKTDERLSSSAAHCILVSEVHKHGLAALSNKLEHMKPYSMGFLIYEKLHQ